jgi:hypothetical protein
MERLKKISLSPLLAVLGLILPFDLSVQTFTNLYNFTGFGDGAAPQGNLVLSGNTLYGTTQAGGTAPARYFQSIPTARVIQTFIVLIIPVRTEVIQTAAVAELRMAV